MNRTLQRVGIGVGVLVGLVVILALALFLFGRNRLNDAPQVATAPVTAPDDTESIEHGRYLAEISSCTECHGDRLQGTPFMDEAPIGYVPAPNLTTGAGGVGGAYTDADWERAIRHGVNAAGQVMVLMPTEHFAAYGDADLADLIAYLKSAPAADNEELGRRDLQFPGNIIFGVLEFGNWPVNTIEHEAVGGEAPPQGETAAYGEYLVDITSCGSCHAENLAGNYGQLDSPQGPNLTTLPEAWNRAEFATALQEGRLPDGSELSEEMPWPAYDEMSEAEVGALWSYLNTLEPLPDNSVE